MSNIASSSRYARQADLLPTRRDRQRAVQQTIKLNVVLPHGPCTGSLYLLELEDSDSSEVVLQKLRLFYNENLTTGWTRFRLFTLLCRQITIETAVLEIIEPDTTVCVLLNLCIPVRTFLVLNHLDAYRKIEPWDTTNRYHPAY